MPTPGVRLEHSLRFLEQSVVNVRVAGPNEGCGRITKVLGLHLAESRQAAKVA